MEREVSHQIHADSPVRGILRSNRLHATEYVVNREDIRQRLELLKVEHRDLDDAIDALAATVVLDQLQLARLKKRKLRLRDEISWCENQMVPDIIA